MINQKLSIKFTECILTTHHVVNFEIDIKSHFLLQILTPEDSEVR